MTATAQLNGGVTFITENNGVPGALERPLAASQQVGKGQFVTVSRTTGYAALNDGSVPDYIPAGLGDYAELSDTSTIAANAITRTTQRWAYGLPGTGSSTDTFTDADWCVPFYIATENTIGKLSHTGADGTLVNRSIGGLVYGFHKLSNTPLIWCGPVAWDIARAHLMADSIVIAARVFSATSATLAETTLPRTSKVKGKISAINIMFREGFTPSDTDYWDFAIAKRTYTTPGTAVSLATGDLTATGAGKLGATITAWKTYSLNLTATTADLDVLETDVFTVVATKHSSGGTIEIDVEIVVKVG